MKERDTQAEDVDALEGAPEDREDVSLAFFVIQHGERPRRRSQALPVNIEGLDEDFKVALVALFRDTFDLLMLLKDLQHTLDLGLQGYIDMRR